MTSAGQRNLPEGTLTEAVVASFESSRNPRYRDVMTALVRHLHAFAREVELTDQEWARTVDFLTRTGQTCDSNRQEFVLLSDVLGVSMEVVDINEHRSATATPSTVLGPFYVPGSPRFDNGDDIANGAAGEPCFMYGRVQSIDAEPIAGAQIEVWQADDDGLYDVQRAELSEARGRGRLVSAEDGRFWFWSVKPEPYPIPTDGPVGELLDAAGRDSMRPAHVHFMVAAPGYERLVTHLFVEGDRYLDSDAVFGVKRPLIVDFEHHERGTAPDGREMDGPFWTMAYEFALARLGDGDQA